MGGMHGFGPVDPTAISHGPSWGARLQALALLSGGVRRHGIESLPAAEYLASSYHEKWIRCCEKLLVESGKVDAGRLEHWQSLLRDDPDLMPKIENPDATARVMKKLLSTPELHNAIAAFEVGQAVRVRTMRPVHHHRCPRYVRGAIGRVEKAAGGDFLPQGPRSEDAIEMVYTVAFASTELWGESDDAPFEVMIDLWQNYLEPA